MKLTGNPQIFDVDPFTADASQFHMLGAKGVDAIGREYRYVYVGASALVKGNLLQSSVRDLQFTDLACAAAAAGQNQAVITNGTTTIAAGDFANGIAAVTVGTTTIGQTLVIKSHTTGASGASITLTFWENLLSALTTSSKITMSPNKYLGVIQSPTTRSGKTVGVALAAITANYYGWIATRGEFGVLSDSTVAAVGEGVSPSTSTAGAVTKAVTLLERIGTAALLGISAKCEPVYLEMP